MPPEQYRRGLARFCGRDFIVSPAVLIPRIETEQIVEEIQKIFPQDTPLRIADVGTGSGCLGITLALIYINSQVYLTDISEPALAVARQNTAKHQVKVRIVKSDLLNAIPKNLDVIVANLPYIPSGRLSKLAKSVRDFEPHLALNGGPKGTTIINRLLTQIAARTQKPKLVLLEIDDTHRLSDFSLPPGYHAEILKDLFRRPRILKLSWVYPATATNKAPRRSGKASTFR